SVEGLVVTSDVEVHVLVEDADGKIETCDIDVGMTTDCREGENVG
ncbi:hypothetical protein A2U01_0023137, partial [Trifolium medium]|nr:hypothetical protein [Trifolium medium]